MGLFDNIFLDKDTPTALLDNPEIKSPDGTKKPEAVAPYDPKNDPIAPAVDATPAASAETADTGDVSFDIGGDLDFSLPETTPGEDKGAEGQKDANAIQVDLGTTQNEAGSASEGVSSIAMIQGGTASIVDGIDIGGISVSVEPGTSSDVTEGVGALETSPLASEASGVAGIEIHSIEDHAEEPSTQNLDGSHGIFGLMGNEESPAPITLLEGETQEVPPTEGSTPEVLTTPETPSTMISEVTEKDISESVSIKSTEEPLDIMMNFGSDEASNTTGNEQGGRIQELIEKLIGELRKLDEEEKKEALERQKKIASITEREEALEHEYRTRKEALKYERSSLEQPRENTSEKNRIKSLIASFEEDLG